MEFRLGFMAVLCGPVESHICFPSYSSSASTDADICFRCRKCEMCKVCDREDVCLVPSKFSFVSLYHVCLPLSVVFVCVLLGMASSLPLPCLITSPAVSHHQINLCIKRAAQPLVLCRMFSLPCFNNATANFENLCCESCVTLSSLCFRKILWLISAPAPSGNHTSPSWLK